MIIEPAREDDWGWILQLHAQTAWESLTPQRQSEVTVEIVASKVADQVAKSRAEHGTSNQVFVARDSTGNRAGFVWVDQKRMAKINGHASLADAKPGMLAVATPSPVPAQPDAMIDESETIRQLYPLGLNYRSLREYALQMGKAEKKGRGCLYSSAFVGDLAENYFTRNEAIDLLKMPPSTFHVWTKKEGIGFVLIGKVSLFRKDLIMEKRRAG